MKKILLILMTMTIIGLCFSGCGEKEPESVEKLGIHNAIITVKDYGEIKVQLDGDSAPITVKNFIDLAESGYYNGSTFHRIIDGFMIQGGMGDGSAKNIVGEFKSNGYENNIKHEYGVISMARAYDPDSASSQFFIVQGNAAHLDGDYAAFGKVTEGMDIVDKIAADAIVVDGNGTVEEKNQPIIEKVEIID